MYLFFDNDSWRKIKNDRFQQTRLNSITRRSGIKLPSESVGLGRQRFLQATAFVRTLILEFVSSVVQATFALRRIFIVAIAAIFRTFVFR
jgi:hypothetical protein